MNKYPYTDFHELNLDWIISKINELNEKMDTFVSISTIKYADPLQWDITKQYEVNTIVSNNNIAYISKRAITVGIDISNTDYWLLVADFSAQITEETEARIEADNIINSKIDSEIQNRLDSETAINNHIDVVKSEAVILIGDSYGISPTPETSWIHFTTEALNIPVFSNAKGGASFGGDGTADQPTFKQVLEELEGNVGDPYKIKKIIVAGGYNDRDFIGQRLSDGLDAFSNYLKVTYPNATGYIALIGLCDNHILQPDLSWDDSDKESVITTGVLSAYKQATANFDNLSFIEGSEYIFRNYFYLRDPRPASDGNVVTGDGIHPSEAGSKVIARGLTGYIKAGVCLNVNNSPLQYDFVPSGSNVASTNLTTFQTQYSESLDFYTFPAYVDFGSDISLFGQNVEIYKINDDLLHTGYVRGLAGSFLTIPVTCLATNSSSPAVQVTLPCTLTIQLGKVYITCASFGTYEKITIPNISTLLPVLYC